MTQKSKIKLAGCIALIIGVTCILGWAGDIDFCDQIILSMTQEEYDSVKTLLTNDNGGNEPSEREIAHWWAEHHESQ